MRRKLWAMGAVGIVAMGMFGSTVAAEDEISIKEKHVINEKWGKPVYAYGSALTDEQIRDVAESFGLSIEEVESLSVSGKDMVHYLKDGDPNSNMYSSALVERKDKGFGVKVKIDNPENITKIKEDQYSNAMITAGVTDAEVLVTSPVAVTGESALTGIYKAFDSQGETLDQDRMEVAQDELSTTAEIGELNKDKEGFSQEKLDDALIAIKQELGESDGDLTNEEIEEIVNNALEERGLNDIITGEQAKKLIDLADNYSKTDAINSEEVKQQLTDLSRDVAEKFGNLKDKAVESGIFEKIGEFFKNLFSIIGDFFKGLSK